MAKRKQKTRKQPKFRHWTKAENQIIRKYYHQLTYNQLALKVKRSPEAIQYKSCQLGLHKVRRILWTRAEIKQLRQLYPNHSSKKVARRINRTTRSVEIKACKLGLKKTPEYREKRARQLSRLMRQAFDVRR
jgi:hypothetical protein